MCLFSQTFGDFFEKLEKNNQCRQTLDLWKITSWRVVSSLTSNLETDFFNLNITPIVYQQSVNIIDLSITVL